jgi:5'(3')-deoxyribonucleotidase
MKKLILVLFLLLTSSCGGSLPKPESSAILQMDTYTGKSLVDSLSIISIDSTKYLAQFDIQKDTIKKVKKTFTNTKLDTVSALPEIRKNMEVMRYQQKQLDSLLSKRKK